MWARCKHCCVVSRNPNHIQNSEPFHFKKKKTRKGKNSPWKVCPAESITCLSGLRTCLKATEKKKESVDEERYFFFFDCGERKKAYHKFSFVVADANLTVSNSDDFLGSERDQFLFRAHTAFKDKVGRILFVNSLCKVPANRSVQEKNNNKKRN